MKYKNINACGSGCVLAEEDGKHEKQNHTEGDRIT